MTKFSKLIIRILKCVICFLTGGYKDKGNGGGDEKN